jgi:hypothetical protein
VCDEELVERVARRFEVAGVIVDSRIPEGREIQPFNHPRREDTPTSATLRKRIFKFFETWNELINELWMREQLITPLSLYRPVSDPISPCKGAQARAGKFFR